ncbi:uncharacterized protein G2W53_006510 [Senna tora]|uniref:Uncharacterized protein n=1 Tax=Senna tora TaxID=362788 RepID=A0A834X3S7_9FABA|nr:uncharacterized protein G2W53_006510 [Senna tora]
MAIVTKSEGARSQQAERSECLIVLCKVTSCLVFLELGIAKPYYLE